MAVEQIIKKIDDRSLILGVVGLGYVGLPLAVIKAKAGFKTIGFDVQLKRVDMVNRGKSYIGDIVDAELGNLVQSGLLSATNDFAFIRDVDFIAICVPTPLDSHQQPDISYVRDSAGEIAKYIKKGSVIVIESTTYPGTTEELVKPLLEKGSGLVCGENFYLGFSPERIDPGNLLYNTKNTPKVVGAIGADALQIIAHLYRTVLNGGVFEVSSPAVAEMEKMLENTYRNVNIGLINELAILCYKMNINIWEVIEAAKTKPYGFQAFYPGLGLGGHCRPLDPYYLSWKARELGFHTSMIESSMIINDSMPEYCIERASKILNRRKKPLNGSRILLLGLAYKQDIDDYHESPALKALELLLGEGAKAEYYDPFVPEIKHGCKKLCSIKELSPKVVRDYDLIMVTTAHTNVDYGMIAKNAKIVFDIRNAMVNIKQRENVEVL